MSRRRLAAVLAAALLLGGLGAVLVRLGGDWQQGGLAGPWRLVFNGYGRAEASGDGPAGTVSLAPVAPARASETHASLVVSQRHYADLVATVRVRTDRQLRPGRPNPWEVAWVLWHYHSPDHFYAAVLKPTGWEVTKQDPAFPGHQQFLATGSTPTFPVGRWHTVRISQIGQEITVSADGSVLTRITDRDPAAYRNGALGLYCEDAEVRFSGFQIVELAS